MGLGVIRLGLLFLKNVLFGKELSYIKRRRDSPRLPNYALLIMILFCSF